MKAQGRSEGHGSGVRVPSQKNTWGVSRDIELPFKECDFLPTGPGLILRTMASVLE